MSLDVDIQRKEAGVFNVSLRGPLDNSTYSLLEKELKPFLEKLLKVIILNMEGVNYISSMGIGTIFKIAKAVKDNQGTFLIINLQPQIKKVFDTVKVLPEAIFRNIEEADAYINEIQKRALEKDKPASY